MSPGDASTNTGLEAPGGQALALVLDSPSFSRLKGLLVDLEVDADEGDEMVYDECDICGVVGRDGRGEPRREFSSRAWDFLFNEIS